MPPSNEGTAGWRLRLLRGRRPLIVATSLTLAVISYLGAFFLRADFRFPPAWVPLILRSLPFLILARLYAFQHYNLLQGWWTSTGLHDFVDIVKAVSVSTALFVTSVVLVFGAYAIPRSVVLIDWMFLIGLLSGSRVLSRLWGTRRAFARTQRTLVVGTLAAMEPLVRDILESPAIPLLPVGLIDLDGGRRGARLHGVPVLGGEDDLPEVLASNPVETVLLALSTREGAAVRRILSQCSLEGVSFKIVPPLRHLLEERLQLGDLRDVDADDLLGRTEVRLDLEGLRERLGGRRVLITGAAGSIGSELARQVAAYGAAEIVLLDRNERALVALDAELRGRFPEVAITPLLCDIRDRERTADIFARHRPEIVYHAAAYKHVPMMEMNPVEAVKNNVLGTRDLLEAADASGVERFVLISTDKAVKPINIMGSTKRIAERLLEGAAGRGCRKIAVRFGNVLGSEGSVVPILLRQIRGGGPVTITHPEATRYFMTIPEAVHLVLQASALGDGGEVFVLDMGEPVRILDLATSLIRLNGLQPGRDIEIRITGLRPGERLHEEALIDAESHPTGHEKIWVRRPSDREGFLAEEIRWVEERIEANDHDEVLRWLRRLSEIPTRGTAS